MMANDWDIAKVCLNGHVLTYHLSECPDIGDYCPKCGVEAIVHCPNCNAPIRGLPFGSDVRPFLAFMPASNLYEAAHCYECGEPYPWAEKVLAVEKDRIIRLTSLAYWFQVVKGKSSTISARFRRLIKPPWSRGEIFTIIGIFSSIVGPIVYNFVIR